MRICYPTNTVVDEGKKCISLKKPKKNQLPWIPSGEVNTEM